MSDIYKDEDSILRKLGIKELNDMQIKAHELIASKDEVILLSPTGTGKTLAFLLPLIRELDKDLEETQALILVPSRELAIQIEQLSRDMGTGFKINSVYGGRASSKDIYDLKHPPAILIGTPGRVSDHIRRERLGTDHVKILVLDEFDKSLEVGFEKEMKEILGSLRGLKKKILTSATQKLKIPDFVGMKDVEYLNFLEDKRLDKLQLRLMISETKDKLEALSSLLRHLGRKRGIVFCNLKSSIDFVSEHLESKRIEHACFYGGLDQIDRERALIKFRNGTHNILLATDLAARGLDVPELDFIIHYQLPLREEEFVHRNGRTARMKAEGSAYILKWRSAELPDYIGHIDELSDLTDKGRLKREWETLFISGGRKDKISKGDIAGLFMKQAGLNKEQVGVIELKQDCAFVSVPKANAESIVKKLNNSKLKKKKVRIYILD